MKHWDDNVRFVGYWELGEALKVEGAVPEKVVCSLYYRPAGLKPFAAPVLTGVARRNSYANFTVANDVKTTLAKAGDSTKGWLVLAPIPFQDQTSEGALKALDHEQVSPEPGLRDALVHGFAMLVNEASDVVGGRGRRLLRQPARFTRHDERGEPRRECRR